MHAVGLHHGVRHLAVAQGPGRLEQGVAQMELGCEVELAAILHTPRTLELGRSRRGPPAQRRNDRGCRLGADALRQQEVLHRHLAFTGVGGPVLVVPGAKLRVARARRHRVLRDGGLGAAHKRLANIDVVAGQPQLDAALDIQLLADHIAQHLLLLLRRRLRERHVIQRPELVDEVGHQDRHVVDNRGILGRHGKGPRAPGGEQAEPRDGQADDGADAAEQQRAARARSVRLPQDRAVRVRGSLVGGDLAHRASACSVYLCREAM